MTSLLPLTRNDTVRLEQGCNWNQKATVLEEVGPRSYRVKTEDGQILRRNRKSLLKTKETLQDQSSEDPIWSAPAEQPSLPDSGGVAEPIPSLLDSGGVAEPIPSPVLRRSARTIKAPDRLNL